MPVQMSYSGRNFDIVTGTSSILVAWLVASGRGGRRLVLLWNVLGLALLLNARRRGVGLYRIAIYLPTNIQRRFGAGIMIPIIYFATRSLEDFWFQHVNRRWRYRLFVFVIPIIMLTHIFVLLTPLLPLVVNKPEDSQGVFLQRDYTAAFEWLRSRARPRGSTGSTRACCG